jgi:uncharacterized protein (DUF58 family)
MPKALPLLLCQVYLALLLLAAAGLLNNEGIFYVLPALVLALVMVFSVVRPPPPRFHIVINLAMIFLIPLLLSKLLENMTKLPALVIQIIALVLTLPAYYLLDYSLRENVRQTESFRKTGGSRQTTVVFISLLVMALVIMLLAPALNHPGLLFSGIAFLLYLLGVLTWILFNIPRSAFTVTAVPKSIIAGTTASVSLELTSRASVALRGYFNPSVPWLKATPEQTILNKGANRLTLTCTPPLAGQSRPRLLVSAVDPRGVIQINESLEPLALHVIPRATYAAWLARKYLEQTYSGVLPEAALPAKITVIPKRGIEYLESRNYQPGDMLRDIDWKHTLKLSQLIVREYEEAEEQAAIIAVNLAVTDDEAMDKLAFNLLTAALTLSREDIPAALAAYNSQTVVRITGVIDSPEMLTQALSLLDEITIVKFTGRLLEPMDVAKIRRNIKQLQQVKTEPAQRLLDLFDFEHRSITDIARNHPATRALTTVTGKVPAPAMIFLISQFNHDTEAVLVTAEKLARRRFTLLPIETA